MKLTRTSQFTGWRRRLAVAASACAISTAQAAPGAHGPDGEHLDGPGAIVAVAALPRLQAHSEAFELVAELKAGEFTIFVDRYDTNAPVLGARLEVESGALKAIAAFRAEQGDYVVTDAALLRALATPGQHPLVFVLTAGAESDLLDGTLSVAAAGASHGHEHSHALEYAAIGAAVVLIAAAGGALVLRRRQTVAAATGATR
jgi:hypothetical protein